MNLDLQRPQEVQNVLYLRLCERVEVVDDAVGFRIATGPEARIISTTRTATTVGMGFDGLQQVVCASVMQEKKALAQAPQRSGAKLVWTGCALVNSIPQTRTHVVKSEVGEGTVGEVGHACER